MNQIAKIKKAGNPLGLALLNDFPRHKGTTFTGNERRRFRREGLARHGSCSA
jgi:hypothetical protein